MSRLAQALLDATATLDVQGLRRQRRVLDAAGVGRVRERGRELVNFSANDYLGLSRHPALVAAACEATRAFGTGAGASPLVTGHGHLHDEAEEAFANFVGMPRALLFASGYAANLGILAALADREAHIFGDRLNHACLVDGALLSRAAFTRFPHRDVGALAHALSESTARVKLVATDAVFSMDGDIAPLREMLALCETHDAWLVVDDAHGIGVLGRDGRGTLDHFGLAHERVILMATLGKALGGYGAFVAGSGAVIDWLVQKARTYVYSTALPPSIAATAVAAVAMLTSGEAPLATLHARIAQWRAATASSGLLLDSTTAIQPVMAGDASAAVEWSRRLQERGFLVAAIRPPTVPRGTSRLRVALSAAHSTADVAALAAALVETRPA